MSARCLVVPAVVVAALTVSIASMAQAETAAERCNRLAAHPADPERPATVEGVATGTIETDAAIGACSAALKTDPDNARLHYHLGRAYFDREDYDTAFREFSFASGKGLAIAKGALGYLYEEGLGTAQDTAKGLALTHEAADAGVGFAAHNLGVNYREGLGVEKDYDKSLAYFRKAVESGYRLSLPDIGYAYDNGWGVTQDYAEAMRWYLQAAEDDNPVALNNIGNLYENGNGVPEDPAAGLEWYRRAQNLDYPPAYLNVAALTDSGTGTPADPVKAATLVLKAFDLGDARFDAMNSGYLHEVQWSREFWAEMQRQLAKRGKYSGAITGEADAATKAAVDSLLDR